MSKLLFCDPLGEGKISLKFELEKSNPTLETLSLRGTPNMRLKNKGLSPRFESPDSAIVLILTKREKGGGHLSACQPKFCEY